MLSICSYPRVYLTSNTEIIVLKVIQLIEGVLKIRRIRRARAKIACNSALYFIWVSLR